MGSILGNKGGEWDNELSDRHAKNRLYFIQVKLNPRRGVGLIKPMHGSKNFPSNL